MDFFIVIEYWLLFYCYIYIYCLPFLTCVLWFWLSHVDRIHLRIKFDNFGKNIKEKIKLNFTQKTVVFLDKYVTIQINSIGEILAGFTDGFLNKKSSLKIDYTINSETQTDEKINLIVLRDFSSQTTKIEKVNIAVNTEEIKSDVKKLFVTNGKKNIIDTEILKRDMEEDMNIKKKEKRIYLVKK